MDIASHIFKKLHVNMIAFIDLIVIVSINSLRAQESWSLLCARKLTHDIGYNLNEGGATSIIFWCNVVIIVKDSVC